MHILHVRLLRVLSVVCPACIISSFLTILWINMLVVLPGTPLQDSLESPSLTQAAPRHVIPAFLFFYSAEPECIRFLGYCASYCAASEIRLNPMSAHVKAQGVVRQHMGHMLRNDKTTKAFMPLPSSQLWFILKKKTKNK